MSISAVPKSVQSPNPLSSALSPDASVYERQIQDISAEREKEHNALTAEQDKATAPLNADITAGSKDLQHEVEKPVEKTPLPVNNAQHLDPKQLQESAQLYMTLGALAGLLTRQPLTAALNNMTSAMEGVQKGDEEQFDKAFKEYKTNFDEAMKKNDAMFKEKDQIIKNKSLSLSEKERQLKLIDTKYGAKAQELDRSFNNRIDTVYKQEALAQKAKDAHESLVQRAEAAQQASADRRMIAGMAHEDRVQASADRRAIAGMGGGEGAGGPISKSAIGMAKTGMPLNQIISGTRGEATVQRNALREAAAKELAEEMGTSEADAGKELAKRTIEYQSGKQSNAQLTKTLGSLRPALDQLKFNADKVDEEIAKLHSSDLSPIVNAIMRKEEQWTGEPAMAGLFYFMNAAAMESARIQSGGTASAAQLHEGAAAEARKFANTDMTPASWKEVKAGMLAEGDNRLKNYEDALGANEKAFQPAGIPSGWSVKVK